MDVSAAGAGSTGPDLQAVRVLAVALASVESLPVPQSPHHSPGGDSVSPSLNQLASPAVQHLLQAVEERLFAGGGHHGMHLHSAAEARGAAERSVAAASQAMEAAGEHRHRVPQDLQPRGVIALASQLIQTGQIDNYLRAAELGKEVVAWYDGPFPVGATLALRRMPRTQRTRQQPRYPESLKRLWHRAPLLVLLLWWLLPGVAVGLLLRAAGIPAASSAPAFNLWAAGFLALVLVQFAITIARSVRKK